eukprot:CAMPEP_0174307656 /NCGR_PEP_ID=MMETSP0810-20121108/1260_1 /TAXON_ID=73025 ORGANISM="Eutreptiella gymnastica-like, Strain CCMP1594" /NCGR_SAMPLE_ID=MMETSP0810 /ASSEMBLY_ACC=CAM_ASM_000659 /LENGTH=294 /DNA_ID=CAMNT_0015414771 /DNA_START=384 /DNA_END=1268 /DNA_ORIENTATION=+
MELISDPETGGLTPQQLYTKLQQRLESAGGHLPYFEHLDHPEDLDPLPTPEDGPIEKRFNLRLRTSSPYDTLKGRGILRVWKARQRMWDEAEKQERLYKATYEFAMWTQDDVFWVGPLSLIRLARAYVRYSDTIWSHKCRAFGGINDRTVLMGRQAAAVLMRAYKSFWDPQLNATSNANQWLAMLANANRMQRALLPFMTLPSVEAGISNWTGSVCIKQYASCSLDLPLNSPPWCLNRQGRIATMIDTRRSRGSLKSRMRAPATVPVLPREVRRVPIDWDAIFADPSTATTPEG